MAKGINEVCLLGNLGADPDIRYLPNGTPSATMNVATSENRRNANDEWEEHTEWHRVVLYGRRADIAREYLHKGSRVHISGKLRTRSWEDKGITRYMTEIIGNDLIMLDGRPEQSTSLQPQQLTEKDIPF